MKRIYVTLFALLFIVLPLSSASVLVASQADGEEGACLFFTETGEGKGGFSVCDDGEARFRSAFEGWGLENIGYPISRRYEEDGFVMQAFQKGIMQWRSQAATVMLVNVFDELHSAGFDEVLRRRYQTPGQLPAAWDGDLPFDEVIEKRLTLFEARSALADAYFGVSEPLVFYGLPTSEVQDMGSHYAIRLQRAVLQEWKEEVPWAKVGQVTIANGGDIAKALGFLPTEAVAPQAEPDDMAYMPPAIDTSLPLPEAARTTWLLPEAPAIVSMRDSIVTVLEANEIEFNLGYPVEGFSPDPIYPRLFIRDTSTLMAGASYFYPEERLRLGVEGFLRQQYEEDTVSDEDGWQAGFGAISATVSPDGRVDKATTVSDEELHLIHAAYMVFKRSGGTDWLLKDINGQPIINRLNVVGDWVLANRRDELTGLVMRDHTTDWGDVRFQPTAGNPTDIVEEDVVWTASIYDQALAYRAWRELAEMNDALGYEAGVERWEKYAEQLQHKAEIYLWMPERGYYRTHLHLTHLTHLNHEFDEDAIVSIANAVSIRSGITDVSKTSAIIGALEQARVSAGANKPGVVLFPAYPQGFFDTPRMSLAGSYQNGGVWDWWGGWQVLAEFEEGYSELARYHLAQTAADWTRYPGKIYEWQQVTSLKGEGGDQYAGAAGIYAQVIIEGLYGVRLSLDGASLSPRLADWAGSINVHQPGSNQFLRYNYEPSDDRLLLVYENNHKNRTFPLQLLLPKTFTVGQAFLDGNPWPTQEVTIGQDKYLVGRLPNGRHEVSVER